MSEAWKQARAEIIEKLEVNERGLVKKSRKNCVAILSEDPVLKGKIKSNLFTERIDLHGLPWNMESHTLDDNDLHHIYLILEDYGLVNADGLIDSAIRLVADENRYHPVREYLESLEWDGVPRIDDALRHFLGVERTPLSEEAIRVFMYGALERIYHPGCKFELVLCLVGGQGDGKSTFFKFLALKEEWFTDDLKRLDDENVVRRLQGHWIVEMAEMIATGSAKCIEENKAFLSRQKDIYKVPYDKFPKDVARQCVFGGTSNKTNFLPFDRTGNRRFVPFETDITKADGHILEDEKKSRAYFEQMWAEMLVCYKKGEEKPYLSKEAEQELIAKRERFMGEDTDRALIEAYLNAAGKTEVCILELYREALGNLGNPDRRTSNEIADIMRNGLGWEDSGGKVKRFGQYKTQKYFVKRCNQGDSEGGGFVAVTEQMELPFG